ncbi:hypothetical protein NC652_008720 [Populus alba x Populus x berolinensis]|nr:hypothetical protein NC652_008720 [Populus alba x Populus x berolinensis]
MEVSTEADVDVPSKTKTLDSKSFIQAYGFSTQSQIEALNNELLGDPVISPNSELSCAGQYLVPLSSNSNGFPLTSTSMPRSEETLIGTLLPHILTSGSQISVSSQSNQDWSGSLVANGNEDGFLLDSDQRLVARCDTDNGIFDVDNREPDSPMRVELENSWLVHGDAEHEEEGFGDDGEKEDPRQLYRCEPNYNPMYHHRQGHFDPEFHENHPDLSPSIKRFHGSQVPQWRNRWDDREKTRNQEYGPPGFMQETGPTGVGAGLFNEGNTCYINAVLQCFTHTVPLVQALRSCNHAMPCRTEGFCVLCVVRDHIELSLASSGKILEPLKLVNNLDSILCTLFIILQNVAVDLSSQVHYEVL